VNDTNAALSLEGCRVLVLFGGDKVYGQERANLEVFRRMRELGLETRFVTSSRWGQKEIQPLLDQMNFAWTTAPFGFQWTRHMLGKHFGYFLLNLYGVLVTSVKLWVEARRWKATHLYVMNWIHYSYGWPALMLLRLPMVYRVGDEFPAHTLFHRRLTRSIVKRTQQMVCISKFIMESCVRHGMNGSRTRVIYNYPPHRGASEPPMFPTVPPDAVVITYLGQIAEHKGVAVLLTAIETMVERGQNVVLWLVGDAMWGDDFLAELKRRATAPALRDRVHFFGYVNDVPSVLARTNIHVCPSLFAEPLSNVVGEAKLAARPSVVFPSGGLPELVEHKRDGFICANKTAIALVEGLEYFLDDRASLEAAGEAARQSLAVRFSAAEFEKRWAETFQEAMQA
jgi:glycosyltransferase involved in cell wall biosynthesis